MRRLMIAAILLFACHPAQARHLRAVSVCDNVDVMRPCAARFMELGSSRGRSTKSRPSRNSSSIAVRRRDPSGEPRVSIFLPSKEVAKRDDHERGLVAPLAAKVAEIVGACGSRVISGVRHTFIAGTHRISLHAFGEAADVAGNGACIYRELAGWPGGYSTDYDRVGHVHISFEPNGREWGLRFVHGGRHHRRRVRR